MGDAPARSKDPAARPILSPFPVQSARSKEAADKLILTMHDTLALLTLQQNLASLENARHFLEFPSSHSANHIFYATNTRITRRSGNRIVLSTTNTALANNYSLFSGRIKR